MNPDQVIGILVTVTLVELMVATGLGVQVEAVIAAASDWRLMLRAGFANYVVVPAMTVVLLRLFHAEPTVAFGFMILAVCPGAPYGPALTAIAQGNTATSVGLMALLAASSVFIAPLLLPALLPLTTGETAVTVDTLGMLKAMFLIQLLPLGIGLAARHWLPDLAARLVKPAVTLSKVLNAATFTLLIAVEFRPLLHVTGLGILGMLALLGLSLAAGWLAGGKRDPDCKAVALTTAIRNVGLGLTITAGGAFAGTSAATAVLAYGLVQLLGSLLPALWWRRTPP
ncbi:bile acid:sodium symporter family protein [Microvirga flavescens]|uniref:bile acid:sodium symporter family protein n=1 Tax=Microvirga flavescens TaxID=2249811 RepID=UPI000DD7FEBE|nr:bile acid:sodium symporter [Microvirga flavescens]